MDKYILICEQLGQEPDPDKMPIEISGFPTEVQVAFFVFSFLEDRYEGMSGQYMGKNWNNIQYLFELFEVHDRREVLYIMKIYENIIVKYQSDKSDRKRKADERKSAGGGKTFTHNVQG
mgnify:FL=1